MKRLEYYLLLNKEFFIPLGKCAIDESARRKAEKTLNAKKRKFSVPLWGWGSTIFLAKRITPDKHKKTKSRDAPAQKIIIFIAPLEIRRNGVKIALLIQGEFSSLNGRRANDF